MPSPSQAKPTASVNPAVPHFLQETFRDSGLSARKEVQPVEELLWGGGRDRERKAEGGGGEKEKEEVEELRRTL